MAGSVYKIIEIVGTSPTSWEKSDTNCIGDSSQKSRRPSDSGGRETGRDGGEGQSYGIPSKTECFVQVSPREVVSSEEISTKKGTVRPSFSWLESLAGPAMALLSSHFLTKFTTPSSFSPCPAASSIS